MTSISHRPSHPTVSPPEASARATALLARARAPVERFLAIESASGILLIVAAAIAMAWANSPWAESYQAFRHLPLGFGAGDHSFVRPLEFWINDGLMVLFFFVVGLEIRREIHQGELSDLKRAALPLVAALGGVLVPALIYVAFNAGGPYLHGWGVPMATDIAFAVGVLTLLGKRVAPALRILLLALAVIDDVIAILVIALFYSDGVQLGALAIAACGVLGMLGMQALGIRSVAAYVAPGLVLWGGMYAGGVHPTLAGVLAGLLTPVRTWLGPEVLAARAREAAAALEASQPHEAKLDELDQARREVVSPVERLQHALHGWVAFAIMPLFALANAGVGLGSASATGETASVFWGVALGLLLGKPIGIMLLSRVGAAAGMLSLPRGVNWRSASIVGVVGGIGFTMALFVAQLAFPPGPALETAKLGVLCGSAGAAVLGLVLGRLVLPLRQEPGAATSELQAEQSTAL